MDTICTKQNKIENLTLALSQLSHSSLWEVEPFALTLESNQL